MNEASNFVNSDQLDVKICVDELNESNQIYDPPLYFVDFSKSFEQNDFLYSIKNDI